MASSWKIVYFGTSRFAVPALAALVDDARTEVVLVVSQPDRPGDRGRTNVSPVASFAKGRGLPLLQPETLKDEDVRKRLASLDADLFVVAAYGKIIAQAILDMPRIAPLNLHGSLLPAYRGASPIQAAILDGVGETGVSLMRMDAKMDHGPVYATATVPIGNDTTFTELESRLAESAAILLMDSLPGIADGTLRAVEQAHDAATFCRMISRADGEVRWAEHEAERIVRMIAAYDPWPGCFTFWDDAGRRSRLRILAADPVSIDGEPGTAVLGDDGNPLVHAKKGAVRLTSVQPEGKHAMDAKAFLQGHSAFIGSRLG